MTTIAPPPPATAGPPPSLTPGGRSAWRALLVVAAAVLMVGTVIALGVLAWGISTFRVITDSTTLPTAMRSLIVDTGSVPVAVRLTTDRETQEPRADLRMVNNMRAGANPLTLNAAGSEARITIDGEPSPFLQWSRAGEITVVLPPDLARRLTVTIRQDTGVLFANADLDQLIAHTEDGAVLLRGAARRIEVYNVHGEIASQDPISVTESFSATTTSGDIRVDFAEPAPRTVNVSSEHGDVDVSLPPHGPYLVEAGAEWGDTEVRVPRTLDREAAAAVVTARAGHGDVTIDERR